MHAICFQNVSHLDLFSKSDILVDPLVQKMINFQLFSSVNRPRATFGAFGGDAQVDARMAVHVALRG